MCDFCKEIIKENDDSNREELIIQRDNGRFDLCCHAGGGDWGAVEDVEFCPKCGRNLTEVSE
ncbi:hypothetical protein C810_01375 [Lachnospiraceae bacterium A2]|nr:hypothetical protein C810_01375 [Lachnospiraceae bacterium A2]